MVDDAALLIEGRAGMEGNLLVQQTLQTVNRLVDLATASNDPAGFGLTYANTFPDYLARCLLPQS